MIARELERVLRRLQPRRRAADPALADEDGWHPGFLSNVNAAYRRAALEAIPFRDVALRRGPGVARDLLRGRLVEGLPPARRGAARARLPVAEFMRRYFDEYRGLRETIGHVEAIGARSTLRARARARSRGDRALDGRARLRRAAQRARLDGALGRPPRRPARVLGARLARRAAAAAPRSARCRSRAAATAPAGPRGAAAVARRSRPRWPASSTTRSSTSRATAPRRCSSPCPGRAERERLHVAIVIPPFGVGSGGHDIDLPDRARGSSACGHTVSIWVHDPLGLHAPSRPAVLRAHDPRAVRAARGARLQGLRRLVRRRRRRRDRLADGVFPVLRLARLPRPRLLRPRPRARVLRARPPRRAGPRQTYRRGCTTSARARGSPSSSRERYGGDGVAVPASASTTTTTARVDVARRRDTVVFYGRDVTARRAVPLGAARARRAHAPAPATRIVMFGDREPIETSFPYEHAGRRLASELARLYTEATVGLVPVDDELLARAAGDARLRPAVRRPRRLQRRDGLRRRRAGRARAVRRGRARRTPSSA